MGSFIEYSKNFIDDLHGWHSLQSSLKVNKFTKSIRSLHFYDSVLIVEKRAMKPPVSLVSGKSTEDPFAKKKKSIPVIVVRKAGRFVNTVLQLFRLPSVPKI